MRLDPFLRDSPNDFRHRQSQSLLRFGFRHEERVEHADALGEHRDLEAVLLFEILQEFAQGHLALYLKVHGPQISNQVFKLNYNNPYTIQKS